MLNDSSTGVLFSVCDVWGFESVSNSNFTSFVLEHTHTCCVSFCAEEEIHLPTGGHCAHANCFEEPFFILYGAISSESLFENRQTLTLILELWHGGMQNAVLFTSLALCSGSATRPPRQFPGAKALLTPLRLKTGCCNSSHALCLLFSSLQILEMPLKVEQTIQWFWLMYRFSSKLQMCLLFSIDRKSFTGIE